MTVSGGVQSRMGEIEVKILRMAAGFVVSNVAELRQIATTSADGSRQKLHDPAIECDKLAGQCEGIGGREGTAGGSQSHRGADSDVGGRSRASEMRPRMRFGVFQLANGSRVCGCARAERRWHLALEHQPRCTEIAAYTAGTERELKSAAVGEDC
jgi:hypothetical protein